MNSATIRKGEMETNKRGCERGAQGTGRNAPRLQAIPRGLVIPAKAGTYPFIAPNGFLPTQE